MKLVMAKEGYKKVGDKYLLARKCTKCGKWLVASTANFHKQAKGKKGLHSQCKECVKQYYQANKEKIDERHKQYCETNKKKIAEYYKQYGKANKKKIAEYNKQYCEANKERITERKKQYYQDNKEMIAEYRKQWYEANPEYYKQYYEANKERVNEYRKQYYQTPQGQISVFNKNQRRRTREEKQGTGITKEQWLELMSFFDWKCAYSGEYLGGNNNSFNRTIDHIVPISTGGDNMIWNCVPMLRSLNSSKNSKDMEEWYKEQSFYSEARLAKIYEWQEYAYNKWGKDTQYFNTNDIQIKLI